jgi:hypothetical protein
VETFKRGMQACFAEVAKHNMDIFITPHVNDGGPAATWCAAPSRPRRRTRPG